MTLAIILALVVAATVAYLAITDKKKASSTTTSGTGTYQPIKGDPTNDQPVLPVDEVEQELAPESTPAPQIVEAIKSEAVQTKKKTADKKSSNKKAVEKKPTKKVSK